MKKIHKIALFEGHRIRRHWDADKELWYFSVVDVVRVLTNSVDAGAYWRKLKQRLKEEGSEFVTKCHELKFMAKDGTVADNARKEIESKIGKKAISNYSFKRASLLKDNAD